MVSWSDRGSMVDWSWLGFGIGGSAFVLDIGNMAALTIGIRGVGDSLGTAVGKEDIVGALGGIAITGLICTKPHVTIVAILGIDSVLVGVEGRSLLVGRSGGIARVGGRGHGGESKEGDEGLKI